MDGNGNPNAMSGGSSPQGGSGFVNAGGAVPTGAQNVAGAQGTPSGTGAVNIPPGTGLNNPPITGGTPYISNPPRRSPNARNDDIILVPDAPQKSGGGKMKYIIFGVVVAAILAVCGVVTLVLTSSGGSSGNSTSGNVTNTNTGNNSDDTSDTPIVPETDLGKAWMRYATFITEGDAKDEGLEGEYEWYVSYAIDEVSNEDVVERETFFNRAKSLFEVFYTAYNSSKEKKQSMVDKLVAHKEKLDFITTNSISTIYDNSTIANMIRTYGVDKTRTDALERFSTTYASKDLQDYNALMIELVNQYIDMYNLVNDNDCLTENWTIGATCYDNATLDTRMNTMSDRIFEIQEQTSTISYNTSVTYMDDLWGIAEELEDA